MIVFFCCCTNATSGLAYFYTPSDTLWYIGAIFFYSCQYIVCFFYSSYFLFCAFAFLIFELLFDCRLPVCLVAMHCDKWTLCYFTLAVYIYIYMRCLVRFFFILICFCCLQPNASKASSQSNAIVFDTVL